MGLDRDEIDLYLDAQVQKIEQATDAAERKKKGKLCPFCNKPIPQLAEKCPFCEEIITPEASKELQEILDNLEEALVALKSGWNLELSKATVERYARKAKLYYSNNPKIKTLLEEIKEETEEAEKRIKKTKAQKSYLRIIGVSLIYFIVFFLLLYGIIAEGDSEKNAGISMIGVIILSVGGWISLAKYLKK